MRVEVEFFREFIEKATINASIGDIRLNFGELGVELLEKDEAGFLLSKSFLKKKAFRSYEQIGEIAISNTRRFIDFLKRLGGEVEIKKENVKLVISSVDIKGRVRKFEYILSNIESMPEKTKLPQFEFEESFEIESNVLKEIVKNAETVGKGTDIHFETKEKNLIVTAGNDDKFVDKLVIKELSGGVNVLFGEPFKVVNVLDGKVRIALKTNYPMKIIEKDEFAEYVYIIAPKVIEE